MRVLAATNTGQILFSNVPSECISCARRCGMGTKKIVCDLNGETRRQGRKRDSEGDVYICSSDSDLFKSKKIFTKLLDALHALVPSTKNLRGDMETEANLRASRLVHNLKSINAHSIQEIFALVPQELLARGNFHNQVDAVSEIISSDPARAAIVLLKLNKHQNAAKCEFGSFQILNNPLPEIVKKNHPIHRVVLNTLNTFFADFTDKGIYIDLETCEERVDLNYETFQVALYHILQNATKYVADNTNIVIKFFRGVTFMIDLEMTSLEISDEDAEKIFEEGYSTDRARELGLSGDGLGLGIVQRLLGCNGGHLEILRDMPGMYLPDGYRLNIFRIHLPI